MEEHTDYDGVWPLDYYANHLRRTNSKGGLLYLLNQVIRLFNEHYEKESRHISINEFTYCIHNANSLYKEFTIPKKSGGLRTLHAPQYNLKYIQSIINVLFSSVFSPDEAVHGFVAGRSIRSNAALHVAKPFVLNVDIKDFFPSTHAGRIMKMLMLPPFYMNQIPAQCITDLVTLNGFLPQGAPTSPLMTNVVCKRIDRHLDLLAAEYGATYSRYADDLTFSSDEQNFDGAFFNRLAQILKKDGYRLNAKKTRLLTKANRQEVTGITVNEKLNVPRKYVNSIRAMIHNWEVKGLDWCQKNHLSLGHQSDFMLCLSGKLEYLGMVRGKNDPIYKKYHEQYLTITNG